MRGGAAIGREGELAALARKLRDPQVRLVTVTGPGGVGKTRLAQEIVALVDGPTGPRVVWVDLAPVAEAALVLSHYPGQDSRIAWTNVRAAERTPAAVLAALASGAFYASSGAEIHDLRRVDGGVEVRASPARAVFLRSGPWDGCGVDADPRGMHWRGEILERTADGAITAARFETPEFWTWGRIEVRGRAGGRAWSNPFTIGTPNGGTA